MPVGSVTALSTDADAVWILTSAFIIFSMQSGFGLLETGMVSRKNETNVMVKNALDVILGGLSYWMFGFAFSFGQDERSNFFSGVGYFFTDANEEEMGAVFAKYFFQLSFATTATTVVSGAMAERTSLKAYMAYSFLNTISYCFPAHWVWDPKGWLFQLGGIDIAGCSAVHLVGGSAALVAAIMLKPRYGRFDKKIQPVTMASPTNVVLGTFMLWWGWLGFNCGSTFGISGGKWKLASRAAVVTMNGSIGGGLFSIVYCFGLRKKKTKGKLDIGIFSTSILGGLVGITAICAICRPWEAILIGFIGAAVATHGNELVEYLKIDDPVGCIGIHCMGGIWGMLAVGLFAEHDKVEGFSNQYGLFKGGSAKLFGVQVAACVSIITWSSITTFCQLSVIDKIFGLRVPLKMELLGADYAEHGIVEDRLTGEETVNHAYGKKIDHVDNSCLELSPKLKKRAQKIRQRKISRNLSALSALIGPVTIHHDLVHSSFSHNLSDVPDEDEEEEEDEDEEVTQIDNCEKLYTLEEYESSLNASFKSTGTEATLLELLHKKSESSCSNDKEEEEIEMLNSQC